jgi:hypothetical protein
MNKLAALVKQMGEKEEVTPWIKLSAFNILRFMMNSKIVNSSSDEQESLEYKDLKMIWH